MKSRYPEVNGYSHRIAAEIFSQIAQHAQLKLRYEDLLKVYMETRAEYRDTLDR